MRNRPFIWLLICLLLLAGGLCFWQLNHRSPITKNNDASVATVAAARPRLATTNQFVVFAANAPSFLTGHPATASAAKTNPFAYRLSNTPKTVGQLLRDDHAILLENAVIDTRSPLGFSVPQHLRAAAEPGSYIVQARGPVDNAFRAAIVAAGGTIISYIPNNAYLVRLAAEGANRLSAGGLAQAVSPFEPVYKLKSPLLNLAMEGKPLPPDTKLDLMLLGDLRESTLRELQQSGAVVLGESPSPFGPVLTIQPGENWTAPAQLPGVIVMEQVYLRVPANDLSRVRVGVASDLVATNNYLDLTGKGVLVSVNDTGVDPSHPDLTGRIIGDFASSLVDDNGHGTFVAGEIAGSGAVSATVSNVSGSINPGVVGQYRGKAPAARIFSQSLELDHGPASDAYLQISVARTNALISNNSWHYGNNNTYGMASASYDAAVRDALPGVTGSQPVLFVFAAGNAGEGSDSGLGGDPGGILAPGTAKNVLTVGATELARNITNAVVINCTTTNIDGTNVIVCKTNYPWQYMTDSDNEVASFSSRGNVGRGVEGDFGRFKPDVVAPGTFVVSTRSSTWDEKAYYNPTSHFVSIIEGQSVEAKSFDYNEVSLPANAVGFTLRLLNMTNLDSGRRVPELPIYVRKDDYPILTPPTFDFVKTNFVSVPPDGGGVIANVEQIWFYGVFNTQTQDVSFDMVHDVIVTNLYGNQLEVLSNLNNSISGTNASSPQYYRYESGTSMAAADVSGTLALMQQFFQDRRITNSPALMKALLINGARSVGGIYDYQVQNAINYQGWGLINLANSLPSPLTNGINVAATNAILLFDQSPAGALATGQSQTRLVSVSEAGRQVPLRITLVWTDPPGNPAAGVKLVNDLDLVVTNLSTGDVYFGNDFPANSTFTFATASNAPPIVDSVNNVENVYLTPSLGTNYSVTVYARRVNVNAVTAQTNNVVQDYALVISSGNGETATLNLVSSTPLPVLTVPTAATIVSNLFSVPNSFTSGSLTGQRVGANTPLLGTTNGMTNQWHFFIVTNTTTFTNASFLISASTDLAIPRIGVYEASFLNATRRNADLDLYGSQDPGLLQLSPAAIAGAVVSRSRNAQNGDEAVIYNDSTEGQVYYIGVKSEDQMAGEFDFFAVFSLVPLAEEDADGFVQAYPFNPPDGSIPDGTPDAPGIAKWLALVAGEGEVRRVIVTNSIIHENFPDVVGALVSPNRKAVVLNNHTWPPPPTPPSPGPYNFLYEDNDEGDYLNAIHPEGPGELRNFVGDGKAGQWHFFYVDNAKDQTGRVANCKIKIERQPSNGESITNTVAPNSWQYYAVNVPVGATNLTACLALISAVPQPLELYVRKDQFPTATVYDYTLTVNPPTGPPPGVCLAITPFDLPPLTPGRYYVGIFNGNPTSQTYVYTATYFTDPNSVVPIGWGLDGNNPLRDDAVTDSIITVTNDAPIQQVEVGLRIDHPRVSDLAVTLISPRGTRVLLAQNRGGTSTEGFGSTISVTNIAPASSSGGPEAVTNVIATGATSGSLTLDYNFFCASDRMLMLYDGVTIFDTGLTNNGCPASASVPARVKISYGPGVGTDITVVMNPGGNTDTNTAWEYTVSSVNNNHSYLTFTENTNLTTTPIKFAAPPLTGQATGPVLNVGDFESPQPAGDFVTPANVNGWSVLTTNPVTVIVGAPPVTVGRQSLALRTGQILRTVPTLPGRNYQLNYDYRAVGNLDGIVSWWEAENNPNDKVDGNTGVLQGVTGYTAGEVGQAFVFDGTNSLVRVPASANLDVGLGDGFAIEGWINPFDVAGEHPIAEWSNGIQAGVHLWISVFLPPFSNGAGTLYANIVDELGSSHYIASSTGLVTTNVFQHVALTYDKTSGQAKLYLNGAVVALENLGTFTPATSSDLYLGRGPAPAYRAAWWDGIIDEMTIYSRALQDIEVQNIYAAGAAGKCGMSTPPAVCDPAMGAQIFVAGQVTNIFLGATNWQSAGLVFAASSNLTTIGLSPVSGNSGVVVDSFTLVEASGTRYVLPEDSLEILKGENARGDWTLELWDSRTGATNQVSLVSWQMQFIYQTNTSLTRPLQPGVPVTTTIPPGQIAYYIVDVPAVARFATNILYNATPGPLGFYFNQDIRPAYGATNPPPFPDVVFAANAFNWTEVLSTPSTIPPTSTKATLQPGQRYYLAIENQNAFTVSYTLLVDFDLAALPTFVTLTNGVPYCAINAGPAVSLDYYRFQVSPNAVRAQFEINNPSGDMTLLLRRSLPPTFGVFDYISANVYTNDELIVVSDFTQPVPLTPGDWYLGAANISGGPVSYCVKAIEWAVFDTNIVVTNIVITNAFLTSDSFCLTWTSQPGTQYHVEGLTDLTSTNWVTVSPTITAIDYATTHCIPLPSPFSFFRVREGTPLNPYFPPPVISSIRLVFNGVLLTWGGPINVQYQVQWSPTLAPPVWTPFLVPPAVSSATGLFQFLDDGSETGGFGATLFYRLLQLP